MTSFNRRRFLQLSGTAVAATALPSATLWTDGVLAAEPVKLGLLHSLTGTIAIAEAHVSTPRSSRSTRSTQGAASWDGRSSRSSKTARATGRLSRRRARKLLEGDKVAAVFGCYTSASRKAVLPVLNQHSGLLYYPTYYEGQEMSQAHLHRARSHAIGDRGESTGSRLAG